MAHLCKCTVEAYLYREVGKGYWFDDYDLHNAIIVAEDFLEMGEEPLWLSDCDLNEFITWAQAMLAAPEGTIL